MFEEVTMLQSQLNTNNQLVVHHEIMESWVAECTWNAPLVGNPKARKDRNIYEKFPEDYKKYLAKVSDGCALFTDPNKKQFGCRFLNTDELAIKQREYNKIYHGKFGKQYVIFAEFPTGGNQLLVFDLNKPTRDGQSFAVIHTNPPKPPKSRRDDQWHQASRSFSEWLGQYITAQGSRYWMWK